MFCPAYGEIINIFRKKAVQSSKQIFQEPSSRIRWKASVHVFIGMASC